MTDRRDEIQLDLRDFAAGGIGDLDVEMGVETSAPASAPASAVRSGRGLDRYRHLVPTEHEKRSCAGMGPRIRAREIARKRQDPKVALGDQLSSAAHANDVEKVRSLLEQNADPNHVHFEVCCDVPLARTKSPEVAKLLLAHPEINVNARDINRYSIFSSMVLHNRENVELVSQILAHKDLDVHAGEPIKVAARFAPTSMLRTLLHHPRLSINDPCGLLHCAVRRTDAACLEVVTWLLQHEELDINLRADGGSTALMNVGGWDSLTIEIGEKEAVKRRQIAERQVKILQMLLVRSDLDVTACDSKNDTALHRMSRAGRLDLVQVLLKDPRCLPCMWQQNADGQSPLDAAVAAGEKEKSRKRWEVPPHMAKFDKVIGLLEAFEEEKKAELVQLVPRELARHPGTWSMAVNSL
ncbi:unnamed protein product [Effrenium voratum]|nr:unnamed protein product [Effrenium voratum]